MIDRATRSAGLSRKEWALVALGLGAWIAIGAGGFWFVHQVTRLQGACAGTTEAPTRQATGSTTSPRNAFQAITGQGSCK